jgi:hypothetical protein
MLVEALTPRALQRCLERIGMMRAGPSFPCSYASMVKSMTC